MDKVKNICVNPCSSVVKKTFLDCFSPLSMVRGKELCDLCVLGGSKYFTLDILGFISCNTHMNAVPKPRQKGQRSWTDAQRAEQARKLHTRKIWLASTGPRTVDGKIKSSQNARSASYEERQELKAMCRYLRTQKSYTELIKFYTKQGDSLSPHAQIQMEMRLDFFENELIDIERQMFHGLRFYEIISGNIIPFPTPPPPF